MIANPIEVCRCRKCGQDHEYDYCQLKLFSRSQHDVWFFLTVPCKNCGAPIEELVNQTHWIEMNAYKKDHCK